MVDVLHGKVQDDLREAYGEPPSPPTVQTSWYNHIKPNTEFATVRWAEEDIEDDYEWTVLEIIPDSKDGDWFSRSPLRWRRPRQLGIPRQNHTS